MAVSVSAAVLSLHTSLQVLTAYETSVLGLGCPSQTGGDYAAFKNSARKKKEGGVSRKVVMNPRPRENPAQNDHPDYQESPWAFIIRMEPLKR